MEIATSPMCRKPWHEIIALESRRAVSNFSIMREISAIGECWRHLIRPIDEEGFPQEVLAALIWLEAGLTKP